VGARAATRQQLGPGGRDDHERAAHVVQQSLDDVEEVLLGPV
jgi:hypothetical protein